MKATLTALAILSVAGCSGGPENGTAPDSMAPDSSAEPTPGSIAMDVVVSETGANRDELEVMSVQAVEFSDSSLGCPQPDLAYLQVITPGHKVQVRTASGEELDVRVSGAFGVICRQPPAPLPKR